MSHAWHDPASKSRTGIEILLHIFRNWQTGIARLRSGVSERKAGDQEFQAEVQEIARVVSLLAVRRLMNAVGAGEWEQHGISKVAVKSCAR
jgi:hypothetical protein